MKVLAVASKGGHWEELLLIVGKISNKIIFEFAGTNNDCKSSLEQNIKFYKIIDFNRNSWFKMLQSFIQAYKIIKTARPDALMTTGAAPGVTMVIAAKLLGIKTIWIDSVANVERLSLSGRLIKPFVSRIYTQWPHLRSRKVMYAGSVID